MFELVNQHVAKIMLAVENGDTVTRISEKIGASYGWTHNWIVRLEGLGVVTRVDGVEIVDDAFADAFATVAETVLQRDIELEDAYLLPNFAKLPYAFTRTDAVYVWTKGGYQIGRSRQDYPLFIAVREGDIDAWKAYFARFELDAHVEERHGDGIYFVLFPESEVDAHWVEHAAVIPLPDTVSWAKQHVANFQPALEMLDEMYDLDLGATYRERPVG